MGLYKLLKNPRNYQFIWVKTSKEKKTIDYEQKRLFESYKNKYKLKNSLVVLSNVDKLDQKKFTIFNYRTRSRVSKKRTQKNAEHALKAYYVQNISRPKDNIQETKKTCHICSLQVDTIFEFYLHMKRAHLAAKSSTTPAPTTVQNVQDALYCSICSRPFTRQTALNAHMSHHSSKDIVELQNKLTCSICKLKCTNLEQLREHRIRNHKASATVRTPPISSINKLQQNMPTPLRNSPQSTAPRISKQTGSVVAVLNIIDDDEIQVDALKTKLNDEVITIDDLDKDPIVIQTQEEANSRNHEITINTLNKIGKSSKSIIDMEVIELDDEGPSGQIENSERNVIKGVENIDTITCIQNETNKNKNKVDKALTSSAIDGEVIERDDELSSDQSKKGKIERSVSKIVLGDKNIDTPALIENSKPAEEDKTNHVNGKFTVAFDEVSIIDNSKTIETRVEVIDLAKHAVKDLSIPNIMSIFDINNVIGLPSNEVCLALNQKNTFIVNKSEPDPNLINEPVINGSGETIEAQKDVVDVAKCVDKDLDDTNAICVSKDTDNAICLINKNEPDLKVNNETNVAFKSNKSNVDVGEVNMIYHTDTDETQKDIVDDIKCVDNVIPLIDKNEPDFKVNNEVTFIDNDKSIVDSDVVSIVHHTETVENQKGVVDDVKCADKDMDNSNAINVPEDTDNAIHRIDKNEPEIKVNNEVDVTFIENGKSIVDSVEVSIVHHMETVETQKDVVDDVKYVDKELDDRNAPNHKGNSELDVTFIKNDKSIVDSDETSIVCRTDTDEAQNDIVNEAKCVEKNLSEISISGDINDIILLSPSEVCLAIQQKTAILNDKEIKTTENNLNVICKTEPVSNGESPKKASTEEISSTEISITPSIQINKPDFADCLANPVDLMGTSTATSNNTDVECDTKLKIKDEVPFANEQPHGNDSDTITSNPITVDPLISHLKLSSPSERKPVQTSALTSLPETSSTKNLEPKKSEETVRMLNVDTNSSTVIGPLTEVKSIPLLRTPPDGIKVLKGNMKVIRLLPNSKYKGNVSKMLCKKCNVLFASREDLCFHLSKHIESEYAKRASASTKKPRNTRITALDKQFKFTVPVLKANSNKKCSPQNKCIASTPTSTGLVSVKDEARDLVIGEADEHCKETGNRTVDNSFTKSTTAIEDNSKTSTVSKEFKMIYSDYVVPSLDTITIPNPDSNSVQDTTLPNLTQNGTLINSCEETFPRLNRGTAVRHTVSYGCTAKSSTTPTGNDSSSLNKSIVSGGPSSTRDILETALRDALAYDIYMDNNDKNTLSSSSLEVSNLLDVHGISTLSRHGASSNSIENNHSIYKNPSHTINSTTRRIKKTRKRVLTPLPDLKLTKSKLKYSPTKGVVNKPKISVKNIDDLHDSNTTIIKGHRCAYCKVFYINHACFAEHMKVSKLQKCSLCNYFGCSGLLLSKHYDIEHCNELYSCCYCNYASDVRSNYEHHLINVHESNRGGSSDSLKKPFIVAVSCSICNKAFSNLRLLKSHVFQEHGIPCR